MNPDHDQVAPQSGNVTKIALTSRSHRTEKRWWDGFAVDGIRWRRFIDWAVMHVPAAFHPVLLWIGSVVFFFVAAPARESVVKNLNAIFPHSRRLGNYFRTLLVFANFGWMLADSASHRLRRAPFVFELQGEEFLDRLGAAEGAIVLTAHMGNYDLGAAMFDKRFHRQLRIVRASEPDSLSAQHMAVAFQQSGNVKVDYSDNGTALAFDLLNALRAGEIISIQGDRVVNELARAPVLFFGRNVTFPTGPFVLSLVSGAPIFPLFVVRTGRRKYKVVAYEPIVVNQNVESRDQQISHAMEQWSAVLEEIVRRNWSQWYGFKPLL